MKYSYVKVSKPIAAALGLLELRKEMRDGTVLLNQKDIMNGDGVSLEEKAALIGGVLISEEEALKDAEVEEVPVIEIVIPDDPADIVTENNTGKEVSDATESSK